MSKIEQLEKTLAMTANTFVIVGIIVAVISLHMTSESEKRQNAITAISTTRSSDFLKAYTRLKTVHQSHETQDAVSLIDDLNFVMNTYDNIALLYSNHLADRCLIKNSTYPAIKEILSISGALSYPKESIKNLEKVSALMEKEVCE
ncbi:MAG TPA: hypothetical protein VF527_12155 [Pyrinomonadaceae bacterium]|jgi:hypothetical protein